MHFHLVDGHWQMNVGALSDVKVGFSLTREPPQVRRLPANDLQIL